MEVLVDPAGKDRCFHRNRPGLRKSPHPAVQLAARRPTLAFPVNSTTRILDAIADRLLVHIQPDVNTYVLEEPPWLFSESTFPLSSVFSTPRAPPRLSIQTVSQSFYSDRPLLAEVLHTTGTPACPVLQFLR